MAYSAPPTVSNTLIDANFLNVYIRDNQRALKDPPSQNYESNEASDYSKTLVAWADVDTDFNFSITTTGGDVLLSFTGVVYIAGGSITKIGYLDVSVDGTRIVNQTEAGLAIVTDAKTLVQFTRLVTGLSAAAHTFNLQWKPSDGADTINMYAGAGTASYDVHPTFWVRELT